MDPDKKNKVFLSPRVLGDIFFGARKSIRPVARNAFVSVERRLNLNYSPKFRFPLEGFLKIAVSVFAMVILFFGSVAAPTVINRASGQSSDEERRVLEAQLQELEKQIGNYEDQVTSYQKQGKTLKEEISRLNDKIAKLNLQIQAINLTLREFDKKIGETKSKIVITEETISARRLAMGRLLQGLYENDGTPLLTVFLSNPKLSDFFGNIQGIVLLQNNLRLAVLEMQDLRNQLNNQREELSLAKADAESAKNFRQSQKEEIDSTKSDKNRLLEVTKGQESKYQTLLKQTKQTAADVRKRIFKLLGGGELSFEDAYKYAKLAGGATGVRPALILAVLDRESELGQNIGKCNYKTAMSPSNQQVFLELTSRLNINPDVVTVSCPNRDGVYGGAVGAAQFIPLTWKLYSDSIAKITGNDVPSPWNNADAFAAAALYLKDSLRGCLGIYYSKTSQERCAAAKYYAGGRWRGYLWTYGEAVVSLAAKFEDDIATITT